MTKKRQSKGKEIRPTFFVFCEGETEETYVKFLRSRYRVPVEIDAKIAGNRITAKYISNYKQQRLTHPKDKTFLIYDCDVQNIVDKLHKINKVSLILSNPCFELWYLLHFKNQTTEISSEDCISALTKNFKDYQKGILTEKHKEILPNKKDEAILNPKKLVELRNPSTNVYVLLNELDIIKTK